jgi:hypothetical protein
MYTYILVGKREGAKALKNLRVDGWVMNKGEMLSIGFSCLRIAYILLRTGYTFRRFASNKLRSTKPLVC